MSEGGLRLCLEHTHKLPSARYMKINKFPADFSHNCLHGSLSPAGTDFRTEFYCIRATHRSHKQTVVLHAVASIHVFW